MLILKLLFACLIIGGVGSLFVWRKKTFAIFAPIYFSMFGASLGFGVYALTWFSTSGFFDSGFNWSFETLTEEITPVEMVRCGCFVFITFIIGIFSGISFAARYSMRNIAIKRN